MPILKLPSPNKLLKQKGSNSYHVSQLDTALEETRQAIDRVKTKIEQERGRKSSSQQRMNFMSQFKQMLKFNKVMIDGMQDKRLPLTKGKEKSMHINLVDRNQYVQVQKQYNNVFALKLAAIKRRETAMQVKKQKASIQVRRYQRLQNIPLYRQNLSEITLLPLGRSEKKMQILHKKSNQSLWFNPLLQK